MTRGVMTDFKKTWASLGINLPNFWEWLSDQDSTFSTDAAAKLAYLAWLYSQRAAFVSQSLIGDCCPFAKEVRLACDHLSVTGDETYADRLIRGERLNPNLHPDYVAITGCYGASGGVR